MIAPGTNIFSCTLLGLALLINTNILASESQSRFPTRVEWLESDEGTSLRVPLTSMLTAKQREMIDGGFTTMSQFDILVESKDERIDEPLLWSSSCTVKFDAWDESYEVTRYHPSRENPKSDSAIFRKFRDYGDFCLTAVMPLSDTMVKVVAKGQKLIGRLTVQQMSAEEGARIKEWLVRQQSGLMQSLFKHMLGELALHQSLAVSITIPPVPQSGHSKVGESPPNSIPKRGP